MSSRNQLTKDLNESIKSLLGKHVKILLKNVVKLEIKTDKTENRVLVFSPCRLFLLTAKVPTRIDTHCHYLDIHAIESKKPNQLSITAGEKIYTFLTADEASDQEVNSMIQALYTALHNFFPSVPFSYIIRRLTVLPESRVQHLDEQDRYCSDIRGIGPCGGFSTQYACMCDYHSLPYREEVAWDVDTIYLSHDTRELCLRDFEHLDMKDLIPIISALEYNTWFTKIRTSHIKLTHEAVERLLHVMKRSLSIEELYLESMGFKWDFAHKLSLALIANGNSLLNTIDLSNNLIEDKGASSLCGFFAKINQNGPLIKSPISRIPKGLVHLNLSQCGLTSKGIHNIAHAFSVNKCMANTLTHLNLCGNNLKEDITSLCTFLAQPNVISHLDLSRTDCSLETIFGPLLRGCATNLVHLNVSHNMFNLKKNKELPPSFKQFFTSCISLKYVNVSYCKLPVDALKNLLLGLACNETIVDVKLDISCNNLSVQGSHVLESCIHGVRSVSTLDISENNMDVDLASVITAISKNKSMKHLYMGKNMINIKAKYVTPIIESLVHMLQEEDCVLQTLSIPDCKLKSDLFNLINALGGNLSLITLDVSGNHMGDLGARLLGKALQVNTHLKNIIYDKNNISLQGYTDLAYAIESNYTLSYMPVPMYDVVPCMKLSAEKTESTMKRIQDTLHRNVSPKRFNNGHAFRLQQGFMSNNTQQMIDKLVSEIHETMKSVHDANHNKCDLDNANKIIKDAENSKHLLASLHDVILKIEQNGNIVDLKLRKISDDLHSTVAVYLQAIMEDVIKAAEEECPTVFLKNQFHNEIRSIARMKNYFEPEFIYNCIVEQAGTQVLNKINELNLAVAAHVSDKVGDEVMESLSRCKRSLIGDARNRSATPDLFDSSSRLSSFSFQPDSPGFYNHDDRSPILEYLNLATPHLPSKRKNLNDRRSRPKSVVDYRESNSSADDIRTISQNMKSTMEVESLDSVSVLPTNTNTQLKHLAKGRPKRAKTRAGTKLHVRIQDECDGPGAIDTFFSPGSTTSSIVTPLISPNSDDSFSSILTDATLTQSSSIDQSTYSKANHNSLPKKSHLENFEKTNSSSRSISSDNLSKFFNNFSPFARRLAINDSSNEPSPEKYEFDRSRRTSESDTECEKSESKTPCKSPTISETPPKIVKTFAKSPVLQRVEELISDSIENNKRWAAAENENKLIPASGNKTDGLIIPMMESNQEPDCPQEKKSVRELAASLIMKSADSPDNQKKIEPNGAVEQ